MERASGVANNTHPLRVAGGTNGKDPVNLVWTSRGYVIEFFFRCIQTRDTNFGASCICRVPKTKLEEGKIVECVHCGCRGCSGWKLMTIKFLYGLIWSFLQLSSTMWDHFFNLLLNIIVWKDRNIDELLIYWSQVTLIREHLQLRQTNWFFYYKLISEVFVDIAYCFLIDSVIYFVFQFRHAFHLATQC